MGVSLRDLELLGSFLDVYRAGSMTAAASRAGLSQPSISERIAKLEEQLGEPLFTRARSGVVPTPAGDRLAARVGDSVDRLRGVWEPSPDPLGTVRIGGASDLIALRVVPALATVASRGVALTFSLGLARESLELLAADALDVVVSSVRVPTPGIRFRGLIDEEFVLVGSPSLARTVDSQRMSTDPAGALAHLPLVAYDEALSIVRRYWRTHFGQRPANPVSVVVPDLRGVLSAVISGAGVSALPRYVAESAIATGSVEVLHDTDEPAINTLYVALAASEPTPATTLVVDTLVASARRWDML